MLKLYPQGVIDPEYQFTSLGSDIRVNCPTEVLALQTATYFRSPVYRYIVTYWPSTPVHALGLPFPAKYAFHSLDLFAFFGLMPNYIKNPQCSDMDFQQNVRKEVLHFVKTGHPYSSPMPWDEYPSKTGVFTTMTDAVSAYNPIQCQYLLMKGFFSYAWIN